MRGRVRQSTDGARLRVGSSGFDATALVTTVTRACLARRNRIERVTDGVVSDPLGFEHIKMRQ